MDAETQEVLLSLATRIEESAAPLIFYGSSPATKETVGVVIGLKRAVRRFVSVNEKDVLALTEEEYANLVSKHDFVIAINIAPAKEITSYLPLDLRNNGAYSVGVGPIIWPVHNFDLFITMPMPGIFPMLIRILGNRK